MKTTIELPDALAHEAKELAHDQGVTLRQLIVDGLRTELQRRAAPSARVEFNFPTFDGGGLQPGVEWTDLVEMSQREITL